MSSSRPKLKPKAKTKGKARLATDISLVTAIVGLLATAVTQIPKFSTWIKGVSASIPFQVVPPVDYPKVVPSYLRAYYGDEKFGGSQKLYWFHSNVRNKTGKDLELEVQFFLDHCEGFVTEDIKNNPTHIIVNSEKLVPESFHPPLMYIDSPESEECNLSVQYRIDDAAGGRAEPLRSAEIQLLPRQQVMWDLKNVEGEQVSQEFLLATLTAWSQSTKDPKVHDLGIALGHLKPVSSPDWLRLCYEMLFRDGAGSISSRPAPIVIDPTGKTYPFKNFITLLSPGEIVTKGRADPLEAAFLMASVINAAAARPPDHFPMTLFILPQVSDIGHPAVLLGTSPPGGEGWEVVDLRRANSLDFDANLRQSTTELQQLLSQKPEILQALRDKGVFLKDGATTEETSPSAISFNIARQHYHTLGLP